ncbi:hypothetical protein [Kitasatospora sp. NPDC088134]|uniref:hypothetical protein n=1 Tax=Kitasatospora sp. NPDC088134 TaxID=3364071 RepID=UPI003814E2E0
MTPERLPTGLSAALALSGAAALAAVLALLGEAHGGWFGLAAYAAGCWALGARSRPVAAPFLGLAAWLFHNGCTEHRYAALGWDGWLPESGRFVLLAGAALLGALLGGAGRNRR